MHAAHTDVAYPNVGLVAAAELDLRLVRRRSEQMDEARVPFSVRQRLKHDVIAAVLNMLRHVNQLVDLGANLERVRVDRLADLTLELLPID